MIGGIYGWPGGPGRDASALDGVLCDASFNHDIHASAEYRQHLCTVMAKRAVTEING